MKKIPVHELRLGMYLQELCGSWMDHPFWKSSFLLDSERDLEALRKSNVEMVWIDPDRGLDTTLPDAVEEDEQERTTLNEHLDNWQDPSMMGAKVSQVSYEAEIDHARRVYGKAKAAMVSMFSEVRMGNCLPVEQAYPVVEEIHRSVARNTDALISLVRLKNQDQYTYLHSVAVCALMIGLGKQLGLEGEALRRAGVAGLFHDAGKMRVDEAILNKPDRLTDEEFGLVKAHPVLGYELLREARITDEVVLDVCRHHHERLDRKGYPDRLSDSEISLYVRMATVCDVYDAITSDRCYKKGWEPALAIHRMAEWQQGHFDEKVFHAFVRTVGIYPCGTLVRLKSGRLGTVLAQNPNNLLRPRVRVHFSIRLDRRIAPEIVDLDLDRDAILGAEDPAKWGLDPASP